MSNPPRPEDVGLRGLLLSFILVILIYGAVNIYIL